MARRRSISDERLLEVACDRFLADGVGASTRAIAADAGVSEGVLFQRFGTKDELFFRAMRVPRPDLTDALRRADRAKTLRQGLGVLALAALDSLREAMPITLLVVSHPAREDRLRAGSGQAPALLEEALGLREAFRSFLGGRGLELADPGPWIGVLMATLLTRALHEQVGMADPAGTRRWLGEALAALDTGLEGAGRPETPERA